METMHFKILMLLGGKYTKYKIDQVSQLMGANVISI